MPVTLHTVPASDIKPADIERWRAVPVAIAVDLGRDVGQIDPAIRPLRPAGRQPRLFGRAVTALCEPPDFGAVLYALDLIRPGDVLVIAAGGRGETAMIGEILGGHLRRRGAVGVVCDGAVRDVGHSREIGYPVWSKGASPITGKWRIETVAINVPVAICGIPVTPGDLVVADEVGVCFVPRERAADVLAAVHRILEYEAKRMQQIASGLPVPDLAKAPRK